ncbi:hypothetical protein HY091_02170 [Candidatus Kaiserbacteria bacterium]|nr:hypothetical protein [Candidatus Kaiserbacteria bacterium]
MNNEKSCGCAESCGCNCGEKFEAELKRLLEQIAREIGRPTIDYLETKIFRVWVQTKHYHDAHGYGSFAFEAPTLLAAAKKCLAHARQACPNAGCSRHCPEYDNTDFF